MSIFNKIKTGLQKSRSNTASGINNFLANFRKVDRDALDELEEMLILADFGPQTAADVVERLEDAAKKQKINDRQTLKQVLCDTIIETMPENPGLILETRPSVIFVIGVNGVGKTTSIGKIGSMLTAQGKKVLFAAADTFRAAASEQLSIWAARCGADIVKHTEGADPSAVIFDAISAAKARGADVVICDTAGRLHNKSNLMHELEKMNRVIDRELPDASKETLLVLDATTGQNAIAQAESFAAVTDITGLIVTKLDGTAKGGIAANVSSRLGVPVKLIGVGEKADDLLPFDGRQYVEAFFEEE